MLRVALQQRAHCSEWRSFGRQMTGPRAERTGTEQSNLEPVARTLKDFKVISCRMMIFISSKHYELLFLRGFTEDLTGKGWVY